MLKSCWKTTNELKLVEAMSTSKQYAETRVHVCSQSFCVERRMDQIQTNFWYGRWYLAGGMSCVVRDFKDTSEPNDRFVPSSATFQFLSHSRVVVGVFSVRIVGACRCNAVSLNPFCQFFARNLCVCCPFVIHGHVDGDNTTLGSRVFFFSFGHFSEGLSMFNTRDSEFNNVCNGITDANTHVISS